MPRDGRCTVRLRNPSFSALGAPSLTTRTTMLVVTEGRGARSVALRQRFQRGR
jgi:hypothetical protein